MVVTTYNLAVNLPFVVYWVYHRIIAIITLDTLW